MRFKSKTKKKEEEERIQWFETAQSLYLIENSTKQHIIRLFLSLLQGAHLPRWRAASVGSWTFRAVMM